VALVTAAAARGTDEDEPLLLAALSAAGVAAEVVAWDDPSVQWARYDRAVVRSTWDYAGRRGEFLDWADHVGTLTQLLNGPSVLRWNTDKAYLRELDARGVPVVPTWWLSPGGEVVLPDLPGDVVVKPTVSAGARDIGRYPPTGPGRAGAALLAGRLLNAGRQVMVQPYIASVDHVGERALLFVDGRFSHAIGKDAILTGTGERLFGEDRPELFAAQQLRPLDPSPEELAVAQAALRALELSPGDILYGRVDLVSRDDGKPLLLELELTEPSMFLRAGPPQAAVTFARAIARA